MLGITRVCADDVGMALRSPLGLHRAHAVFSLARRVAAMKVNAPKCNLVPLSLRLPASLALSPGNCRTIVENAEKEDIFKWLHFWLLQHIPHWASFGISDAVLYLGAWLGPGAGPRRWNEAVAKWQSRSLTIAGLQAPPSVLTSLYAQRAAPCLGFLAHFFPPPDLGDLERRLACKIQKFPFTMLPAEFGEASP